MNDKIIWSVAVTNIYGKTIYAVSYDNLKQALSDFENKVKEYQFNDDVRVVVIRKELM